ncbi:isopentenyl-diphosphate delta-isomerase idi1 [Bonamia ostreae]|uniref:isopentenyl-diphosphate Delta-isomerase n=1 Tax=Bonamia ostreae TaxID=126728 RepID=A0ABV2AHR1_9EUKA
MDSDLCILVDRQDRTVDFAAKRFCHKSENIKKGVALHRAFSVFLFDSQNRLLLQRRADQKITFPALWTNSCCSHPLASENEDGGETFSEKLEGVKRAACRKMKQELGLQSCVSTKELVFVTRIIYSSVEQEWGEHEVDYVLFMKKELSMEPNSSEVGEVKFVTASELQKELNKDSGRHFTPWFKFISKKFLLKMWERLDTILAAGDSSDRKIHQMNALERI